jgi:PAS domain S-box-containing protein
MFIWRWLRAVPLDDPVERRLAPLLQLGIIAVAVALGVAFVIAFLQGALTTIAPETILLALLFWLALGSMAVLLRRGYFKMTTRLLLALLLTTAVRRLLLADTSTADESLLTFFLPLTIAGLFLSRRVLLAAISMNALLVLLPSENQKLGGGTVTTFLFQIVLVSFLLDLLARTLRGELSAALVRNQELEQARYSLETYSSELFKLNERLNITLRSIGDAVITTDSMANVMLINDVAQRLTGWTQAEAEGQPLTNVFNIVNEHTRQPVENPAERVIREGVVVGLANHTVLIAKDGREIPIDDSGAPIADGSGKPSGVVLVFRDITERKQTEMQEREMVAISERQRLARELHDAVSQALFSANIIAESLPRLWERNPEKAMQQLDQLQQLTQGASAEMRTLLLELRPENVVKTKLEELLTQLCLAIQGRRKIKTSIQVQREEEQLLPEEVHLALYRIAQESFNNIARHGNANLARVRLVRHPNYAELIIVDNGQGFDMKRATSGFGLTSMRERAASINASLQIRSKVGVGTRVKLVWRAQKETEAGV